MKTIEGLHWLHVACTEFPACYHLDRKRGWGDMKNFGILPGYRNRKDRRTSAESFPQRANKIGEFWNHSSRSSPPL